MRRMEDARDHAAPVGVSRTMSEGPTPLLRRLGTLEEELAGVLGVAAHRLERAESGDASAPGAVSYRSDGAFPAASTIKVFVLQALLERVAAGGMGLEDEIVLRGVDQVTGSGVLKALSPGRAYTVRDLATLMIVVSDNTATNVLIERLGVDAINDVIDGHGWSATSLAGLLQRPDLRAAGDTRASTTSPRDLADAFARLWRGELLPPELTAVAQGIYRRQQATDLLGRYLPFDAYSTETGEDRFVIASKYGALRGVRNDAGVIDTGRGRYVVAVMTRGCPDERFHPDNLGALVVAKVSRALYEHFGSHVA
jgi:beta-lactamase class A